MKDIQKLHPKNIETKILSQKNEKIIIACSGGPDSMFLLDICRNLLKEENIIVGHINHELRNTALRDEKIVRDYCKKYSLTLEIFHADIKKESKKTKTTIEECARNVRKKWLEKIRKKYHANKILTAHHADDQAETILYRVMKGTGLQGLVGIEENNGVYYRPLLSLTKKAILEYTKSLPFGHDETNDDTAIPRNAIRKIILPEMEKINPEVKRSLIRLGVYAKNLTEGFEEFFISDGIDLENFDPLCTYEKFVSYPLAFRHELLRILYTKINRSSEGLSQSRFLEFDRFFRNNKGGKKEFGNIWMVKKQGNIYLTK